MPKVGGEPASSGRYSGRRVVTFSKQQQALEGMTCPLLDAKESPSKRYRRTVGATSREAILEEHRYIDSYRQMSKSQTFSGGDSTTTHGILSASQQHQHASAVGSQQQQHFSRHGGGGSGAGGVTGGLASSGQVRATLPHDYKTGTRSSWTEQQQQPLHHQQHHHHQHHHHSRPGSRESRDGDKSEE
ncbi:hypothetical protein RRG08_045351 [Elysia crispata]|uniref:Uncharacterized protein n=1 Tax=Elysia crispata TaxID=231223 RepID=A0AAE1A347_9GAST|nr:hypothetical protein RRG08_045351 [Elysia crispata]